MGIQMFDTISQNFSSFSANQGHKKNLDEKLNEKAKLYNYIGMETYDLYKEGKLAYPELDVYFEKMTALEQEIEKIQMEINKAKTSGNGSFKCTCGNILSPDSKFCPKCGKAVETDLITCSCGRQVKRDMAFCSYCGQKISELSAAMENLAYPEISGGAENVKMQTRQVLGKECICGAIVPAGQFMCMECGRRIAE